uniref:Prefoldin subunit 5-like n=1 Tax=Saccoglossus kowalevskii TaxID=10224 RepID=A0ABM0MFX4_SACKO|nr:PREDICTED: prefoldin subunit 5-like [Saccoglossus kowalevskii]
MQLPLPQLDQLKNNIDQELEFFSSSITQLRIAQTKLQESCDSLSKLNKDTEGKEILVPLTSSLYVPGKLSDVNNVLIDVGTGYYVEKNVMDADKYFKRKIDFINTQVDKLTDILQEKVKLKQAIVGVMQMKIQAQMMAQQSTVAKT